MSFVGQIKERDDCELVAACDYKLETRDSFRTKVPSVAMYDTYEEFLAADTDVVVIATYCPDHAPQAVQALKAGKHVLSEVTAFHTLAQGVELCRTVEATGRAYMMAENTCYFPVCEEMTRIHQSGKTGEFMYAECEYIHDLRPVWQIEPDGSPHWRLWQPCIYYCSHSLGPVFQITGDRPVSVVGLDCGMKIDPERPCHRADAGVALIKMAGGGMVKLLTSFGNRRGAAGHFYVLYGTKGNMENDRMNPNLLHVRLMDDPTTDGWVSYEPKRQRLAAQAAKTGHGGADFYTLHDFVEAIKAGSPPPFDVYASADMTLPGILAHRSATQGGKPQEVPDFRDETVRKRYENDHWSPKPTEVPR
jgi:predicted dehydrogenase